MVRKLSGLLLWISIGWPPLSAAVTADELRAMTSTGEEIRRGKDARVKASEPDKLLDSGRARVASPSSASSKEIKTSTSARTNRDARITARSPQRPSPQLKRKQSPTPAREIRDAGSRASRAQTARSAPNKSTELIRTDARRSDGTPVGQPAVEARTPAAPTREPVEVAKFGGAPFLHAQRAPPKPDAAVTAPASIGSRAVSPPGSANPQLSIRAAQAEPTERREQDISASPSRPSIENGADKALRPSPLDRSNTATPREMISPPVMPPQPIATSVPTTTRIVVADARITRSPFASETAAPSLPGAIRSPIPPPDLYLPPPRPTATSHSVKSDAVVSSKRRFGISIGTWFKARLGRNVSNSESGLVELTVEEDVAGMQRVLSGGTILFAEKTLNESTRRLELRVVKGITPNRMEFELSARAFDLQRVGGVNAIITGDNQAILNRGASRGLLAGARAAVQQMLGTAPVIADATRSATDSMIADSTQINERSAPPTITGYSAAQELWLRVEETF